MIILSDLLNLTVPGLFALINEEDRKLYLGCSSSIIVSLNRFIDAIQKDTHSVIELHQDKSKLQFVILEEIENRNTQQIRMAHYVDKYKEQGYTLYNKKDPSLRYKIRYVVAEDYRNSHRKNVNLLVYVVLTTNSYDKTVIGIFPKMSEAKQFVSDVYGTSRYIYPVYSLDSLTKTYYCTEKHQQEFYIPVRKS